MMSSVDYGPKRHFITELADAPTSESIQIITAVDMSIDQKARLENLLSNVYHRKEVVVYEVKPSVIGGVALVIGDLIIDNTIRQQLYHAKKRLTQAALVDGISETQQA